MFDNNNPYELKIEKKDGKTLYFANFTDANKQRVEEEISRDVAKAMFVDFVRVERNLLRWDERHKEQSDVTEQSLNKRILHPPLSVEDQVFKNISIEKLYKALELLTEMQKRRVILYFFENMTYEEIGMKENCSKSRVKKSIDRAVEKLKNFF